MINDRKERVAWRESTNGAADTRHKVFNIDIDIHI